MALRLYVSVCGRESVIGVIVVLIFATLGVFGVLAVSNISGLDGDIVTDNLGVSMGFLFLSISDDDTIKDIFGALGVFGSSITSGVDTIKAIFGALGILGYSIISGADTTKDTFGAYGILIVSGASIVVKILGVVGVFGLCCELCGDLQTTIKINKHKAKNKRAAIVMKIGVCFLLFSTLNNFIQHQKYGKNIFAFANAIGV